MGLRSTIIGTVVLAAVSAAAAVGVHTYWRAPEPARAPALADVPALPAASGTSVIVAPVTIPHTAIRDALEAHTPRELTGKRNFPPSKYLSNAEIGWTVRRGALAVHGKPETMAVLAGLGGTLRASGQLSNQARGRLGSAVSGLLGEDAAKNLERLAASALDQRADIRGTVTVLARPAITPAWRFEPNLTPQLAVADVTLNVTGTRLNVAKEVSPLLEKELNEQLTRLQERLRNDPFLERAARREWEKLCRAFPIGAAGPGLPNLWLELRPTRAIAAQPRIDGEAVTLVIGLEAETRVIPNETKPECPFPATLTIVPQADPGRVKVEVPIDVPFTEVNRLIAAQLVGKTFPEDKKSGAADVTVQSASVTPSGNRLLISLRVRAVERTSWFGLGTEATVHIWGRPNLNTQTQVLHLSDVALAVESEGALGAAVRAAVPLLERAVADRTAIDLKPYTANARQSIAAAIAQFRTAGGGVRADATVDDLRIASIAFDATTLRIVTEATGSAKVLVTKLPVH